MILRFHLLIRAGFKAVEWGSSIPELHSVQEIVEAKEKAGVVVVGLCTPAGTKVKIPLLA